MGEHGSLGSERNDLNISGDDLERSSSRRRVCQRLPRVASRGSSRRGNAHQHSVEQVSDSLLSPPDLEARSQAAMTDEVRQYLMDHSQLELASVVDKMSLELQQAILLGRVSEENYQSLSQRTAQLRRCTLASSPQDDSPGAVHWFEGEAEEEGEVLVI